MSSTRKSASSNIKTTGDKISKHLEVIIISNTSKSVSSDVQTLRSNTSNTRKSDLSGMRTTTYVIYETRGNVSPDVQTLNYR